jgi:hypothetical protein
MYIRCGMLDKPRDVLQPDPWQQAPPGFFRVEQPKMRRAGRSQYPILMGGLRAGRLPSHRAQGLRTGQSSHLVTVPLDNPGPKEPWRSQFGSRKRRATGQRDRGRYVKPTNDSQCVDALVNP